MDTACSANGGAAAVKYKQQEEAQNNRRTILYLSFGLPRSSSSSPVDNEKGADLLIPIAISECIAGGETFSSIEEGTATKAAGWGVVEGTNVSYSSVVSKEDKKREIHDACNDDAVAESKAQDHKVSDWGDDNDKAPRSRKADDGNEAEVSSCPILLLADAKEFDSP